jgi:hypothetical protein
VIKNQENVSEMNSAEEMTKVPVDVEIVFDKELNNNKEDQDIQMVEEEIITQIEVNSGNNMESQIITNENQVSEVDGCESMEKMDIDDSLRQNSYSTPHEYSSYSLKDDSKPSSDTDSALGSFEEKYEEAKVDEEEEKSKRGFRPGVIVWTAYSRNNWYPCIITEDQNTNEANKKNGVCFKYLNWDGKRGNVTMNNIFAYKGLDEFWTEIVENRKTSKSKIKKFSPSVLRAIEEAKIFMEFEEILRLDIFDAILKLQSGTKYKKVIDKKDIYDNSNGVPSNLRSFIEKYIERMQAYDVVGI